MARFVLKKNSAVKHNNKLFLLKIFTLLFFLIAASGYLGVVLANDQHLLDLSSNDWMVRTDSGWAGSSHGYITKFKEDRRITEFIYQFKATKLWPWPEIDFFTSLVKSVDFSKFKVVQLDIQGESGKEIYFYFIVEDRNLRNPKPLMSRFLLTGEKQKIYLSFSDFKISSDWQPRNPGYNQSIEWNKVKSFGLHVKGRDNEWGRIKLFEVKLLENNLVGSVNLAQVRSNPPRYYLFDLKEKFTEKSQSEITISGSLQNKHKISLYLFGANWGVWLNLPNEKKVSALKLKILRAGGPFMDRYNWRNAKYTFPGNDLAMKMTSLDEFIAYCRRIGAEPLIQINALASDEKSAAGLLRYLNQEKGYNVKFFEIGNEPFIWHKVHFDVRKTPCSIKEYFNLFKKISVSLKKAQEEINPDMKIKIFAPAIETSWLGWSSLSEEDRQKPVLGEFLKMCKEFQEDKAANPKGIKLLDVLSFHLFPSFKDSKVIKKLSDKNSFILESTQTWWNRQYVNRYDASLPIGQASGVIPKLKDTIEKNYPGIELAITEFNIESESMVEYDPLLKVLYLADLYGVMAKFGIDYSMQFCLNSSDQNIALIDDLDNITPLYYPMALYAKYFNGVMLDAKSSLPEKLNVYACNTNGNMVIMAVNKDNVAHQAGVLLEGGKQKRTSFVHVFPALSFTCIKIDKDNLNHMAECWEYGQQQIN